MSPVEPAPECGWALEILLEGRDRLADPETARRLRAHLGGCADCRRVQTAERRLAQALAAGPLPPTPADFHDRVKALVRRRRLVRRLAVAVVAVAMAAAAGLLVALTR
jgi:predicted anti-sigma-YlaC factor YlaD